MTKEIPTENDAYQNDTVCLRGFAFRHSLDIRHSSLVRPFTVLLFASISSHRHTNTIKDEYIVASDWIANRR